MKEVEEMPIEEKKKKRDSLPHVEINPRTLTPYSDEPRYSTPLTPKYSISRVVKLLLIVIVIVIVMKHLWRESSLRVIVIGFSKFKGNSNSNSNSNSLVKYYR